jgi:hypothetical protein
VIECLPLIDFRITKNEIGKEWFCYRFTSQNYEEWLIKSPYRIGDRVRVKEDLVARNLGINVVFYSTDLKPAWDEHDNPKFSEFVAWPSKWKRSTLSARYCPVWASRYYLTISAAYPQQLGDMSEEDAIKEGCATLIEYKKVWQAINGKRHPWDDNLWVWVYEFNVEGLP